MKSAVMRRGFAFAAFVATIFSFVSMQRVGNWYAKPLRVPYSGETYSELTLPIFKDGFYLVQLEVSRKVRGEDLREPQSPPLNAEVTLNAKEIGSATRADWYAQDEASFCFYGFPASKGQRVQLRVEPGSTLSKYKTHLMHLSVERDGRDYGLYLWKEVGWFGLVLLFLLFAAGLLKRDVMDFFQKHVLGPR